MKDLSIRISYMLSVIMLIIGALFRIQHWPYGNVLFIAGSVFAMIYIVLAIIEILNSPKSKKYKILWVIAFILPFAFIKVSTILYLIVSVAYIQHRRKLVRR